MGPSLQHITNTSPITSLAFLNNTQGSPLLLTGEGPFIKILSTASSQPSLTSAPIRIFARERVHGITLTPDESRILFWGGRSILATPTSSLLSKDPELHEIKAIDWIFYAVFLPTTDGGVKVAVITAHNSLLIYTPESGWTELASGERCMLYSAHLLYLPSSSETGEPERVLVAAGTVFGEILLWSTTLTPTNEKHPVELHYRLLGHEGSIFGVNISPLYSGRRYLASCSDDRTVRIWDVSNLSTSGTPEEIKDGILKNTGFGHTPAASSTPVSKGGECISLGWGHTARIWGVRFLPEPTKSSQIRIVSISEDLTSKFWAFTPPTTEKVIVGGTSMVELKNMATYLLHSGKHIWSYALHFDRGLLATGGADGRVGLVEYNPLSRGQGEEEEWDMASVFLNIGGDHHDTKINKDTFKSYAVLDSNRFLVTTSQGRLLTYNLVTKAWKLITQCESLSSWSLVAAWEGEGMVALGNGRGEVGICWVDGAGEIEWWLAGGDERGKVGGVWTSMGPGGDSSEKVYNILTTTLSTSTFTLHIFTRTHTTSHAPPLHLAAPVEEGTKRFLVTSFHISYPSSLIFLGSRNGAIAVYSLTTADLLGCWQSIHETDAITSITPLPPNNHETRILTSGRNGGYSILSFTESLTLTTHHSTKPSNCNTIEGARQGRTLSLWGFRGKSFFIWDEEKGHEVASVECGGSHRAWGVYWGDGCRGWFVWTKASKVHLVPLPVNVQRTLAAGLHGREIKAICVSPDGELLATGAEDTVVRLSALDGVTGGVQGVGVFKRHTTGVHHLCWSGCGRWLFSSGGVEEFYVWRVRREGVLGVVEEARCPGDGGDLRIVGFGVLGVVVGGETGGFVVGMGLSDSSIKIYYYDTIAKSFTLLITGKYKTCCILHAEFTILPPHAEENGRVLLFTAATDGHIAGYDIADLLSSQCGIISAADGVNLTVKEERLLDSGSPSNLPQPIILQRIHQSGIKSLVVVKAPQCIILYTGGDDCALAVTRVYIPLVLGGVVRAESFVLPRAHASAVTAIVVLGRRVVSVGVSQEIKVWEVDVQGQEVKMGLVEERYTCVADVAGAVCVQSGSSESGLVVVGGVGIDVWRV